MRLIHGLPQGARISELLGALKRKGHFVTNRLKPNWLPEYFGFPRIAVTSTKLILCSKSRTMIAELKTPAQAQRLIETGLPFCRITVTVFGQSVLQWRVLCVHIRQTKTRLITI